jgi:N-glycosylase/DNA lyase
MKEQEIILKNIDSFQPKHIFECGQCFRWDVNSDGSYTGIVRKSVLNVKKAGSDIIITGISDEDLKHLIQDYFDLGRDYRKIKSILEKVDSNVKISIKYGEGIRILNQDLWETIISFIISANNNIPRIKGIIRRVSEKYGEKIVWNGKEYYSFPTQAELSKATVQDLRDLGLGFRDIRVFETTRIIASNKICLDELKNKSTAEVRKILLTLPGVGPKVADCVLLFSNLKRLEVFPIDVWVRRVMNDLYIKMEDEAKVDKKQVLNLAKEKYGELAGLAQQYLFYWKREA